jgi:hypothetical protein
MLAQMQLRRRWPLFAVLLACLWFGSIVVWATRGFVDEVPVGTDYNLAPPADVDAEVPCNSPLSSTVRDSEPLPVLAPQPADHPPLAYTREPCITRRSAARRALAIDAVVFIAVIAAVVVLGRRQATHQPEPLERASSQV